jgi:hypothetical protein
MIFAGFCRGYANPFSCENQAFCHFLPRKRAGFCRFYEAFFLHFTFGAPFVPEAVSSRKLSKINRCLAYHAQRGRKGQGPADIVNERYGESKYSICGMRDTGSPHGVAHGQATRGSRSAVSLHPRATPGFPQQRRSPHQCGHKEEGTDRPVQKARSSVVSRSGQSQRSRFCRGFVRPCNAVWHQTPQP